MNRSGVNGTSGVWTDELVERLTYLWSTGKSAREIAGMLGVISRSAVLGKAMRLGLPRKTGSKPARSQMGKLSRRKQHPWQDGRKERRSAKVFAADGFVAPTDEPIPLSQRKTIATLEGRDCRWPIGDPQQADFHFCGKLQEPGLPYCAAHCRRAYQPPTKRAPVTMWSLPSHDHTAGLRALENGTAPIDTKEREHV